LGATLRRVARIAGGVVLVLLLVVVLLAVWSVRRPLPQTDGEIRLDVLDAAVDVRRDEWGVPHIEASTHADLARAQGFVHAQDRFWQMDVWRHVGAGRTAEMFGAGQLGTDRFLRTMGWRRIAEQEWDLIAEETQELLNAYAEGVNAYLEGRSRGQVSVGHGLLRVQNPGYEIEPWEPVDSLTWLKVMAWDLRGNYEHELTRALLARELPQERVEELWPPFPDNRHPSIVAYEDGEFEADPDVAAAADADDGDEADGAEDGVDAGGAQDDAGAQDEQQAAAVAPTTPDEAEAIAAVAARAPALTALAAGVEALTGPTGEAAGSNSWVVSGEHTASGHPLLANDPHLSPSIPSIWYEVGLRCEPQGPDCTDHLRGFSFAGIPGIVIGHNERIAWGFTNLGADVTDFVVERLDPDDPDAYEVDGEHVPMRIREETIAIAGVDDVTIRIRETRNGPVLSDVSDEIALVGGEPDDEPAEHVVALRWTALEPTPTADAIVGLNRARDWDEFREAASQFDVPSQNLVYADVDGQIGYQAPGRIPIRSAGDGRWPAPGWTGTHEWEEMIPFEDLPSVLDPDGGVIVAANNQVVGDDYPYLLTHDWDAGYRAQQIVDRLAETGPPFDPDALAAPQLADTSLNARHLVPFIAELDVVDEDAAELRDLIVDWDQELEVDSAGAAAFSAWWRHLLTRVFHPRLPEGRHPDGGTRWYEVVRALSEDTTSWWWDDPDSDDIQVRDHAMAAALVDAHEELTDLLGDDPAGWRWGDLHRLTLREQTLGISGIGLLERLYNRGPFELPGDNGTPNATAWNAAEDYEVTWVPSMRMVVDLDGFQASTSIHVSGQSGHPTHPHYADMAEHWARGETKPMWFQPEDVEEATAEHLRLVP
jgi:penicillin G amidase